MLDGLFRPRSIAVIGASNNPFSIGNIVIRNLAAHKFKGPIFPINPKARAIRSFKCFKSVLEVPDEIDLVNISVKNTLVPRVLTECGEKGVKFAIVHTAGFKEVGEEGIQREKEMVELAHSFGMRIFGPNSQGVQNSDPEISAYANFTFVPMAPGNISVICQGGGMGELLKLHLHKAGLGHRLYCSYGNEADLTMPELLAYYGQDEGTKAIMMQIESFKDPSAFLEVASEITPRKPILAIKAGRTREGSVAVSSHTGTLVDQAAMATALFRKAGIVEFHDSEQMIKTGVALSTQNPPPGNRIGMITNTGGPGIQMVDEAVDHGLVLSKWSEAGLAKLRETQYAEASLGNPVDVVATGGPDQYQAAVETLIAEEGVDMVLVFFVTAPFVNLDEIAEKIKEATAGTEKPVAMVIETLPMYGRLIDLLRAANLPVYEFAEDGARSLAYMWQYTRLQQRAKEDAPDFEIDRERADAIVSKYAGKDGYLPQADAYDLLNVYGIPTAKAALVTAAEHLEPAAEMIGFPCVLKVDSPDVVHKSDEGGVVLGLTNGEALLQAFNAMKDKFGDVGFLLQEQKDPGRELIVGATEAPGLGTLVMFGLGGIFVEVMKDVSFAVAPLSRPEAGELMKEIKAYPVLEGVRGEPGVDLDALTDLLCRVGRLTADYPGITEMDLNPVFAYADGVATVDVRMKIR
jgi:acetyltransferase